MLHCLRFVISLKFLNTLSLDSLFFFCMDFQLPLGHLLERLILSPTDKEWRFCLKSNKQCESISRFLILFNWSLSYFCTDIPLPFYLHFTVSVDMTDCLYDLSFDISCHTIRGFPGGASVKEHPCQWGDTNIWVQSQSQEDFLEKETGNRLQYFCLENLIDRGAWWATVHGVTMSRTWLSMTLLWKWTWKSLSHVRLFVIPWTIQSMELSRPEYWSG